MTTVSAQVLHARLGWTLEQEADDCVCDAEIDWRPGTAIPTHCDTCGHKLLPDERAELEALLTLEVAA